MPPKKPEKKPPRPVGRPRTIPCGAKLRTIRVTDAEWVAVKQFVDEMRGKTKAPTR